MEIYLIAPLLPWRRIFLTNKDLISLSEILLLYCDYLLELFSTFVKQYAPYMRCP